ncbi:MAG TPA: hypothetical protein VFF06_12390 [Polyangia bacterium]|nr:hypothetical protein [Polyangia bacterium]
MHKRALPILNPCREDWDEMRRDGAGRHCARCDYTVVDLSQLTEREAKRVVANRRGKLCVRYRVDGEGELMFRAPSRRGFERLAAGLGLASLVSAAAPAFADASIPAHGPAQSGRKLATAAQFAVAANAPAAAHNPGTVEVEVATRPMPRLKPEPEYFMGDVSQ